MSRKRPKRKKANPVGTAKSVLRRKERTIVIETDAPHVIVRDSDKVPYQIHSDVSNSNRFLLYGGKKYRVVVRYKLSEPPKNAQRLLSFFLRLDEREAAIGDLVEKYHRKSQQLGKRRADGWIYAQVLHSILPLIMRLTTKIGWLILGEWIKKHSS